MDYAYPLWVFFFFLIWLSQVLVAAHGIFVVASGIFPFGTQALECAASVVAACGLSACGAWALERVGLVALRHVGS